jgi:hypothetical protein
MTPSNAYRNQSNPHPPLHADTVCVGGNQRKRFTPDRWSGFQFRELVTVTALVACVALLGVFGHSTTRTTAVSGSLVSLEDRLVELSGVEMTFSLPEVEADTGEVVVQIAGGGQAPLSALAAPDTTEASKSTTPNRRVGNSSGRAETSPADGSLSASAVSGDSAGSQTETLSGDVSAAAQPSAPSAPQRPQTPVRGPLGDAPVREEPPEMVNMGMAAPENEPGWVWGSADTYGTGGFGDVSAVSVHLSSGSCTTGGEPYMVAQASKVVSSDFRQWMAVSRDPGLESSCAGVWFSASWTARDSSGDLQYFSANWQAGA